MRTLFRWLFRLFILLLVLLVALVLSLDKIAKSVLEHQVKRTTGMELSVGNLEINLLTPSVRVENFTLYNAPQYGGTKFLVIQEAALFSDWDAIRDKTWHMSLVRLDLAEINIAQNTNGPSNLDALWCNILPGVTPGGAATGAPIMIDTLNLSLGTLRMTFAKDPSRNQVFPLQVRDEILHKVNVKDLTAQNIQNLVMQIALKNGRVVLQNGRLSVVDPSATPKKTGP